MDSIENRAQEEIQVVIISGGSHRIGLALMGLLMAVDLKQMLGITWKKSIRLTVRTGILMLTLFILVITAAIVGLVIFYS